MKALVLDDEPMALEVVRALASKVPSVELVACFSDAFAAMAYLQQQAVDLLFLDINMPDVSGLEFVRSLPQKPLVIFTTAYAEYAVTGFELDAVDYLLKPFSLSRFAQACNKAHELLRLRLPTSHPPEHLFLKTGYEQVRVRYEEILYLEATGNYVTFMLVGCRHVARMTLNEAQALLPPGRFARVHRSFVVAKDKIDKIERHQVWLQGRQVPIAASYAENVRLLSQ